MKKLFLLFSFAYSITVNAQITPAFSLPLYSYGPFTTTSLGEKFFSINSLYNSTTDTISIYNNDGTYYRTVNLPNGYKVPSDYHSFLSDKLFNADTLLEILGERSLGSANSILSVINELGQITYSFSDTAYSGSQTNLLTINNKFHLHYQGRDFRQYYYLLPGSLPCNQCNFVSGLLEPSKGGEISELKVFPNPFNSSLEINYALKTHEDNPRIILTDVLGRELKSFPLYNQTDKITLSTSDLPKGTIIVSLLSSGQNVISKKVIKID